MQTVNGISIGINNTDQGKDFVGNYITSLETLDKLVARNQIILCYSLDQFAHPSEARYELKDIIESQNMTFFLSLNFYDIVTVAL